MSTNSFNNLIEFLSNWKGNHKYFDMLALMASLSRLFSDNTVPYLDYRVTENLFCKYYGAINDARSCTAYDARFKSCGIGIKTFVLNDNAYSIEKIAEFNKLHTKLVGLNGISLAKKLGEFRNARISFANNSYGVRESQYHIVGRRNGMLTIFNVPYQYIDVENICDVTSNKQGTLHFNDGINDYTFNRSKSVLLKKFVVPTDSNLYKNVDVNILDNPLDVLENLLQTSQEEGHIGLKRYEYVVLPLYSTRTGLVPKRSGLNQWNALGRARDENEVYIPVPMEIHHRCPDFFPQRDEPFSLILPDGKILSAKICQSNNKALMSNPNNALGEWLLRKVLHIKPGELVTKEHLNLLGIDSVCVRKLNTRNEDGTELYDISFANDYESYSSFVTEQ